MEMYDEFYKASDIQRILRIGRDKSYNLMASKAFPSIKIGRTYIVSKEAFQRWARENESKEIEV